MVFLRESRNSLEIVTWVYATLAKRNSGQPEITHLLCKDKFLCLADLLLGLTKQVIWGSLNKSKAAESKQVTQEVSRTVTLPLTKKALILFQRLFESR